MKELLKHLYFFHRDDNVKKLERAGVDKNLLNNLPKKIKCSITAYKRHRDVMEIFNEKEPLAILVVDLSKSNPELEKRIFDYYSEIYNRELA